MRIRRKKNTYTHTIIIRRLDFAVIKWKSLRNCINFYRWWWLKRWPVAEVKQNNTTRILKSFHFSLNENPFLPFSRLLCVCWLCDKINMTLNDREKRAKNTKSNGFLRPWNVLQTMLHVYVIIVWNSYYDEMIVWYTARSISIFKWELRVGEKNEEHISVEYKAIVLIITMMNWSSLDPVC